MPEAAGCADADHGQRTRAELRQFLDRREAVPGEQSRHGYGRGNKQSVRGRGQSPSARSRLFRLGAGVPAALPGRAPMRRNIRRHRRSGGTNSRR